MKNCKLRVGSSLSSPQNDHISKPIDQSNRFRGDLWKTDAEEYARGGAPRLSGRAPSATKIVAATNGLFRKLGDLVILNQFRAPLRTSAENFANVRSGSKARWPKVVLRRCRSSQRCLFSLTVDVWAFVRNIIKRRWKKESFVAMDLRDRKNMSVFQSGFFHLFFEISCFSR